MSCPESKRPSGPKYDLHNRIRRLPRTKRAVRRVDGDTATGAYVAFNEDADKSVELDLGRLLVLLDDRELFEGPTR
jgi:hypothetical protein